MRLYFSLHRQQLCVSAQAFTIHAKVARFQIRRLSRRYLSFSPREPEIAALNLALRLSILPKYDAKRGKIPPANAIPCCDPDPITGHWPHWIPVDESDKSNIWFIEAYRNAGCPTEEGTYEAIGPHFRANPYGLEKDVIEKHGIRVLPDVPRNFEGIRDYLEKHNIEGIVFWKDGQPQCKIKRSDFGFPWGE